MASARSKELVQPHPAGQIRYGGFLQVVRGLLLVDWFMLCCLTTHVTQYIISPIYWINKDLFYTFMAFTKRQFGLIITTMVEWWCPTTIVVSGEKDVRDQIKVSKNGLIKLEFPERLVVIANHQVYSDWLYLWWCAYTNSMHGHIFIILKESLKYVPLLGPGMMFFGFIFLARKWVSDKERFAHRLNKLKTYHAGPLSGGRESLDPMWLLMFPEGTNLCVNGRNASQKWAEKQGIPDMKHQLLPRSTGLHFCLNELKGTVEWVYDCTMGYEGVPRGHLPEKYFTLRSTFLQGRPPKSVHMYWRRFAVADIPLKDDREFELWLRKRWEEKDELMEHFFENGYFPSGASGDESNVDGNGELTKSSTGYVRGQMRLGSWIEVGQIFVGIGCVLLLFNIWYKFFRIVKTILI
jgi:1-acyl-sn-glycerol-3-phosphate acyltransferase